MMPARYAGLLLLVAIVLQWALPASLAARSEYVLHTGARYYLRTVPVDPVDAFRGRYVALRFADVEVALPADADWVAGTRVAVPLRVGADHFVHFGVPSLDPPRHGDFLNAKIASLSANHRAILRLPFDRYYLNERAAPAAERAYRAANANGATTSAYVAMRVRGGDAVLEELFIDNQPIQKYLAR